MNFTYLLQIFVPIFWINITVICSARIISFPVLPHHVTRDRLLRRPPPPEPDPNIIIMRSTMPKFYERFSTAPVIPLPTNPSSRSGLDTQWTSETGRILPMERQSTRIL